MAKRPDLAGRRIKDPAGPQVYLIDDDGTKRWIPDPPTYNNLFRDWNGIEEVADTNTIDNGRNITEGAVLAKSQQPAVYLIDNGMKRWVTSPGVME